MHKASQTIAAICLLWLAPTCTDGIQNGGETGIDCGGSCPLKCDSESCAHDADCQNNFCGLYGSCQSEKKKTRVVGKVALIIFVQHRVVVTRSRMEQK